MWTKEFWKSVGERALLAAISAVLAGLTDGNLLNVEWGDVGLTALNMGLLSLLASLSAVGGKGTPALVAQPRARAK